MYVGVAVALVGLLVVVDVGVVGEGGKNWSSSLMSGPSPNWRS